LPPLYAAHKVVYHAPELVLLEVSRVRTLLEDNPSKITTRGLLALAGRGSVAHLPSTV
jgi:hypothetical protein